MIEQEQAIKIARERAATNGWAFAEPLEVVIRRGWLGGINRYEIETNAGKLVLFQPDIAKIRAIQMTQDKAQPAGNTQSARVARGVGSGMTFSRAPAGRAVKLSLAALRLLVRTGPLPARRALRSTASQLAEHVNIRLKEYKVPKLGL